ncbi:MAG: hypothetical protein LBM02_03675 [Lachnospiraceae bacterium]|nr:hypothetical protein [Lachnospiraceae bacterium]
MFAGYVPAFAGQHDAMIESLYEIVKEERQKAEPDEKVIKAALSLIKNFSNEEILEKKKEISSWMMYLIKAGTFVGSLVLVKFIHPMPKAQESAGSSFSNNWFSATDPRTDSRYHGAY